MTDGRTRPPLALVLPAALGVAFLTLPLVGLLQRAPWASLPSLLTEPAAREALRLSLVVAATSTVLCLLLGVPLGWVLARVPFPGRRLVRVAVFVPLVLPPVVGGTALLFALGRRGLVPARGDGLGIDVWLAAHCSAPLSARLIDFSTRTRAQRLSLAATTCQGAKLVPVRSTISFTASTY